MKESDQADGLFGSFRLLGGKTRLLPRLDPSPVPMDVRVAECGRPECRVVGKPALGAQAKIDHRPCLVPLGDRFAEGRDVSGEVNRGSLWTAVWPLEGTLDRQFECLASWTQECSDTIGCHRGRSRGKGDAGPD